MLVISQKVGDSFHIGKEIIVRGIDIRGGRVRLGIEAPKETSVTRIQTKVATPVAEKKDLDFTEKKSDTTLH